MSRSMKGTVIRPRARLSSPSACILLSSADTFLRLVFISSASLVMRMWKTLCPAGRRQWFAMKCMMWVRSVVPLLSQTERKVFCVMLANMLR